MAKRIVVALGGNALGNTPEEQLKLVKNTAKSIVEMTKEGYEVIVGHGNGPQVGMINLAMDYAANGEVKTPYMPFAECGAMSQGYIGYHLQQAIREELQAQNIKKGVVTLVTQVVVDKDDPAFTNLTKPIGMFYSKEEADKIAAEKGFTFVEDAGRGYRRVVASPLPKKIVEIEEVETLVNNGTIVITVGGGGIPVVEEDGHYKGVDAVIDKDKSSSKLAADLKADMLVILTAVDKVYINYNKPDQKELDTLSIEEVKKYQKLLKKLNETIKFSEIFEIYDKTTEYYDEYQDKLEEKNNEEILREYIITKLQEMGNEIYIDEDGKIISPKGENDLVIEIKKDNLKLDIPGKGRSCVSTLIEFERITQNELKKNKTEWHTLEKEKKLKKNITKVREKLNFNQIYDKKLMKKEK